VAGAPEIVSICRVIRTKTQDGSIKMIKTYLISTKDSMISRDSLTTCPGLHASLAGGYRNRITDRDDGSLFRVDVDQWRDLDGSLNCVSALALKRLLGFNCHHAISSINPPGSVLYPILEILREHSMLDLPEPFLHTDRKTGPRSFDLVCWIPHVHRHKHC